MPRVDPDAAIDGAVTPTRSRRAHGERHRNARHARRSERNAERSGALSALRISPDLSRAVERWTPIQNTERIAERSSSHWGIVCETDDRPFTAAVSTSRYVWVSGLRTFS